MLKFNFRIIDKSIYPDLVDYKYTFMLNDINVQITIIEHWATASLYVIVDNNIPILLRFNTNLLPTYITNKTLYYDYEQQAFIYKDK